jgi:hypothetical protein
VELGQLEKPCKGFPELEIADWNEMVDSRCTMAGVKDLRYYFKQVEGSEELGYLE